METVDGRLVLQIRNHNKANGGETLQSESSDGGKTWSVPHSIGVLGHPSHLLRLKDGRLLMTYGHRYPPNGNQARLSENGGRAWSEPMIISQDGSLVSDPWIWPWKNAGIADFGYPASAQLDDGSLLTAWYEATTAAPRAVLHRPIGRCKVDRRREELSRACGIAAVQNTSSFLRNNQELGAMGRITRRAMLAAAGGAAAGTILGVGRRAAAKAEIREIKVISRRPDLYHGWPTLVRCRSGRLLLAYSGGHKAHICPVRTRRVDPIDRQRRLLERSPRGPGYAAGRSRLGRAGNGQGDHPDHDVHRPRLREDPCPRGEGQAGREERLVRGAAETLAAGPAGDHRRPTPRLAGRVDGPLQRRRRPLVRPAKLPRQQPARTDPVVRRPPALRRQRTRPAGRSHRGLPSRATTAVHGIGWPSCPGGPATAAMRYHELHAVETVGGRLVLQIRNHNKANGARRCKASRPTAARPGPCRIRSASGGIPSHLLR